MNSDPNTLQQKQDKYPNLGTCGNSAHRWNMRGQCPSVELVGKCPSVEHVGQCPSVEYVGTVPIGGTCSHHNIPPIHLWNDFLLAQESRPS